MRTTAERSSTSDVSINPILRQHLAVYEFAQGFVKDKVVLDAGCGEGYGASLLAEQAKRVVGLDDSKKALRTATKAYSSDNLEFIHGDISHLELAGGSFDVICAFQVIEHIPKPEKFLSKIRQLAKPDGLFFLSTPNRKASLIQHPYHFREYSKEELLLMLRRYFFQVELWGLQFSSRVAAFRKKRKEESQKTLKLDPLGLHRILPRFIRQILFDIVAARLSKKIYSEDMHLAQSISTGDFWLSKEDIDSAIDLVCACRGLLTAKSA